jgi:triacylglycerol esterase/lipase EstA (alpha/beta hydrolase family)
VETVARRRLLRTWSLGLLPMIALAVIGTAVLLHNRSGNSAPPGTDVAQNRPGTVLLVAGYGGSTSSLNVLADHLRSAGRTVQIVPPVGDNTGDLSSQARNLDRAARQAITSGAPSVDVVGYSAGGVVARIWAADFGGTTMARRIVTLGSPHHGTEIAGLATRLLAGACPTACQQLAPGSAVLTGLPEAPAGPRWTSIYTAFDDVVLPPNSASLTGAVDIEVQQVCADSRIKHSDLPKDPLTTGLVEHALDQAAPPTGPPAAAECTALRQAGSR